MLGKGLWLMVFSLVIAGALAGCSSANTSGVAIPVWDSQAAAVAQ
jgi:hypothetical protein